MDATTPNNLKRSGSVSMTTVMLFMGVAVLVILLQPAAAHLPERSLLAILGDIENETEDISSSDVADGDEEHINTGVHVNTGGNTSISIGFTGNIETGNIEGMIALTCPCVRYCTGRHCHGWWLHSGRRCRVRFYCCKRQCDFGLV